MVAIIPPNPPSNYEGRYITRPEWRGARHHVQKLVLLLGQPQLGRFGYQAPGAPSYDHQVTLIATLLVYNPESNPSSPRRVPDADSNVNPDGSPNANPNRPDFPKSLN